MQEVCDVNDIDEDCNGLADNDDLGADPKPDGVVPRQRRRWVWSPRCRRGFCDDPSQPGAEYLLDDSDCDDSDPDVNPSGNEWYGNDIDEDCDTYDYYRDEGCVGSWVPADFSNIQAALSNLQNSSSVETICLSPGTYSGNFTVGGNIELIGTAREEDFIDGRVTLNSNVNGSETTLERISVLDGVDATDNGIATERYYYLIDGSFTSSSPYFGVYLERSTGKTINLTIERSELEGHKVPQHAALAIVDDSNNINGFVNVFVNDSWLRDSAGGIYLYHVGSSPSNRPQLYLSANSNSMTGNDYGLYFTTQNSVSDFDMFNNLMFSGYAGWYWYDVSSVGGVNWNHSIINGFVYTFIYSDFHGNELSTANPSLNTDFLEPIPTANSALLSYGDSSYMSVLDYFRNPRSTFPMIGAFELPPQ